MGCGANPNYFNVFERNHFVEGNTVVNYNTAQGANYNFGGGYLLASTSGGGAGGSSGAGFEELSMNTYTVFRQNRIDSNGGILIEDDSANILVECESHVYIYACVFVCCDAFCHRLHHELTMCPNHAHRFNYSSQFDQTVRPSNLRQKHHAQHLRSRQRCEHNVSLRALRRGSVKPFAAERMTILLRCKKAKRASFDMHSSNRATVYM